MRNAFLRINPFAMGVFVMVTITFAYVHMQPEYPILGASSGSMDR
jgi:hypothetical protein